MNKIMTHLSQHISTPSSDQVQEFHQFSQVDFNSNHKDKQPTFEEPFENLRQLSQEKLSDNVQHLVRLNRTANKVVSGQAKNSLST